MAHSKMCIETILRLYYLRHGFRTSSAFLAHSLTVLAFMAHAQLKAGGVSE